MAIALAIAITGTPQASSSTREAPKPQRVLAVAKKPKAKGCPHARAGLAYYRMMYTQARSQRGAKTAWPLGRKPRSCVDARYLARVWQERSQIQRRLTERHKRLLRDSSRYVICHVFGAYCEQALAVARCESGRDMTPRAHNGQYLGMFQMGSYARSRYGHGSDRLTQALAAFAYFVDSGRDWSPWACKPW